MSTRPKGKLTIYLLKSSLMKREIIIPLTLFLITIPKELLLGTLSHRHHDQMLLFALLSQLDGWLA